MTGPEHGADVTTELRLLVEALLDRVDPWLRTLATQPPGAAGGPAPSCGWCPVCAVVAAVRGDAPEVTRRLAEQGAAALDAVRSLLDQHQHQHADPAPATPPPAARVQPITVRRHGSVA